MTAKKLENMIRDLSISDEEIVKAIKKFTADRLNKSGKFIPPSKNKIAAIELLGNLTRQLRPAAMKKFQEYITKQHENCPACKAIFKKSRRKKH